jgi:uncharacterized damage-inducible protein DinB
VETLRAMAAYNRWANRRVFARCGEVEDELLGAEAKGTRGTIEGTLKHAVMVEDGYLHFVRGTDALHGHADVPSFIAWYEAHDLAWFAERADQLADEYERMLAEVDEAFLAVQFRVPWFKAPMTRREGIMQAFLHSTQHRAQVMSTLGERGLDVPNLDYPLMLDERLAAS